LELVTGATFTLRAFFNFLLGAIVVVATGTVLFKAGA